MRKIYFSDSVDPYFNLALEEYLFYNTNPADQVLYLWQNYNTVVIGRNQNPWKECNLAELEKADGKLVRRLSGGGAVYHDLGNLNFSFFSNFEKNKVRENIEMIICVLRTYNIEAVFTGKNDIQVGPYKVCGNAYFEGNNMLCHHGTLLLDTDINKLTKMLTVSQLKLESKGIDSVRSRIINLKDINSAITIEGLKASIVDAFLNESIHSLMMSGLNVKVSNSKIIKIDEKSLLGSNMDFDEIMAIRSRYASWNWNFGSSPNFNVSITRQYKNGEIELCLIVEDGIIKQVRVSTDSLDVDLPFRIQNGIIDTAFDENQLLNITLPQIMTS